MMPDRAGEGVAIEILVALDIVFVDFGHIEQVAAQRPIEAVRQIPSRLATRRRTRPEDRRRDWLLRARRSRPASLVREAGVDGEFVVRYVRQVAAPAQPIIPVV